ncbi:MAG: class I SAM-dependent methyltransferase [Caldilineaceae bacterium]
MASLPEENSAPPSDTVSDGVRRDYTEQNRRAWNEIADVRFHNKNWPAPEFYRNGGSLLAPVVLEAAGRVDGKTVLHLQCATGDETLSWAVAGAIPTGVDISDRQIEIAREQAAAAELTAHFAASDVYELPADLQQETFDLVYTGGGVLVWLPDIERWAQIVAAALRPGGRFLLWEEHPIAGCLWTIDGQLEITSDYFGRSQPDWNVGWGHFAGGENATECKAEFLWPLGDIITALARAGLRIVSLQEFPSTADWRFGERLDDVRRLPGEYLLVASKA